VKIFKLCKILTKIENGQNIPKYWYKYWRPKLTKLFINIDKNIMKINNNIDKKCFSLVSSYFKFANKILILIKIHALVIHVEFMNIFSILRTRRGWRSWPHNATLLPLWGQCEYGKPDGIIGQRLVKMILHLFEK
jgi:hypothetical protein